MKTRTLQDRTPPGTDVEFLLAGGGKLRGRVLEIDEELVVLEVDGTRQNVFVNGISSFAVLPPSAPAPTRAPEPVLGVPKPPPTPDDAADLSGQVHPWARALELRDEIRVTLEAAGGVDPTVATGVAEQLALEVIEGGWSGNRYVREVLIDVFKMLEHQRDLAVGQHSISGLQFSRALVSINRAMRAAPLRKPIDKFVELYHLLVAVREHPEDFQKDAEFWVEIRDALRTAIQLGRQILNDPAILSVWERHPHFRTDHYRRLARIAQAMVSFGIAQADEVEHLKRDAERYGRLAKPPAHTPPPAIALGHIVSFGAAMYGFIETCDRSRLFVHLRDILTPELQQAAQAAQEPIEIAVDFDVEDATNSTARYDHAVRVRPPGSVCGEVERVDPTRNFGYIRLGDARSVHFWLNNWPEPSEPPHRGLAVLCWPERSPQGKGWTSKHVHLVEPFEFPSSSNTEAHRLLPDALEARDRGNFARARDLFERALRDSPSPQVILSYAATMKEEDPHEAARIYERGLQIEVIAKSYKVWEAAGGFASQRGDFNEAVRYLDQALALARAHPEQRGLKGVLLALGQVHYRRGTEEALELADDYYQEAINLYGGWDSFHARVPVHHVNAVNAVLAGVPGPSLPKPDYSNRAMSVSAEAHRLIEEAADAQRDGDTIRARTLFERGMRDCPTPQMVCCYAAMLKSVDQEEASRIYKRGLEIPEVSKSAKVWEDAGVFATQRGELDDAIRCLERALTLARAHPENRGLKGVLMALGNAHYRRGSDDAIHRADACYQEAIELHGGLEAFRAKMPVHMVSNVNATQVALAQLRSRTPSGKTAHSFLEASGLRVVEADYQEQFSDLACTVTDAGLRQDYGLGERVFVRIYLREHEVPPGTEMVEETALHAATQWQCDASVALLIVPQVTRALHARLRQRVEDTDERRPLVIVPLAQRDLEGSEQPVHLLRKALGSYLYERDLFPRVGIVTGAEFFGRQSVIAEINSLILRGEPIGLFGLRRTGKTSVLEAVKERQVDQGNVVLHADLLGSGEQAIPWLLHTLAGDLRSAIAARLPDDFHWDLAGRFTSFLSAGGFPIFNGFFSDLARVLQTLQLQTHEKRPRIVLVIDELELLQLDSLSRTGDLLRTVRSLQNRYQSSFDYIVTAANASICEKGQLADGSDNPVYDCIRPIYLGFLGPEECEEMITELGRGMGVGFRPDAVKRVYTATAGHPFFARYLCSFAAKLNSARPLTFTEDDILRAERVYKDQRGGDDLWEIEQRLERDYPTELEMLRKLAASFEPIPLDDLVGAGNNDKSRAVRHLVGYQLAEEKRGPRRGVALRMELMRRWLTGVAKGEPPVKQPTLSSQARPQQPRRDGAKPRWSGPRFRDDRPSQRRPFR